MNIYEILASEHRDIFPSSPAKADFVNSLYEAKRSLRIIDIGCASGEFVYQLASDEKHIWGLDLDRHMIAEAELKLPADRDGHIHFYQADMSDFLRGTEPESFDFVTCLGNTIVYLDGEGELVDFL